MRPRQRGKRSRGARRGFALIELIVAISIMSLLAAAIAPAALRQLDAGRRRATREQMEALVRGMVGEPASGDFGYLGDMGALPATLEDLNGTGPAYVIDANDGIGAGFDGPYAPRAIADSGGVFVDAWGSSYDYDGATARITSPGPDHVLGSADDILVPSSPLPTSGSLSVTVLGIPNTGNPAYPLDASMVSVRVSSAVNGVRQEQAMSGGNPVFSLSGLHAGLHGVRVVILDAAWSGAGPLRDVAEIRRGTRSMRLALVQP
jgi:prepilin-type N-terminal cleavage/methylation domain-containing protein